jgi:hypothetical protein
VNALQLLRQMHADTKMRFKLILGADNPEQAAERWRALQPLLELHERMEDQVVYTPLFQELGPGTPLGDWTLQHDADVGTVEALVAATAELDPATPEWRTAIGTIADVLNKHVMEEEGHIFGRVEQIWGASRLEEAGQQMERMQARRGRGAVVNKPRTPRAKSSRREAATPAPARRAK